MARFAGKIFGPDHPLLATLEYDVAVGKPAPEILRVARERSCDLIVISTHGLTGVRKLFFGSTTERVLRETTRPVLITPPVDPGRSRSTTRGASWGGSWCPSTCRRRRAHQAAVAAGLAEAAGVPLIARPRDRAGEESARRPAPPCGLEADRRAVAEDALQDIVASLPSRVHAESLLAYGDPAEELAKVAHDRRAGLVVMGLHGSPLLGPAHGIGDLPDAVSVADAGAGPAAGPGRGAWRPERRRVVARAAGWRGGELAAWPGRDSVARQGSERRPCPTPAGRREWHA